jgi:hypothetical protein
VAFAASATVNTTNAANITSGTLPHAQLPQLQGGDIPNNAANTTGTAANLSGTPALPNGTSATTQSANDNSTKVATTAYVDKNMGAWEPLGNSFSSTDAISFNSSTGHANVWGVILRSPICTSNVTVLVGTADNSSNTYDVGLYQGTAGLTDNLLVHTGAIAGSTWATAGSTYSTQAWTSGNVCLTPGRYYLAIYANVASATMTLGGDVGGMQFYHNSSFSITPAAGCRRT